MTLIEKTTQEDLMLYEILRNPVLCGEFIYNFDKKDWEEPFVFSQVQREILCDFSQHSAIRTARAVGKTVSLVSLITWALIFNLFPNDYIVYTVPNKVHLQPVWAGLIRNFRGNSFLKHFISNTEGFNSSDFRVELLNRAVLLCRIAGQSGTGANIIGLHTPFVILDEAGYYPWGTWVELQPIVNTFTQGNRLMCAGVPTGLREHNVLYVTDMEDSSYSHHRASAFQNPRFTEDDELHAQEQYGGRNSEDYIHLVLGEHGTPIFALFDRQMMEIQSYEVYKMSFDGIKLGENINEYLTQLAFLPSIKENSPVIFGVDLGYTDPTAIIILYQDKQGRLKFHARISLEKVSYNLQDRIIDYLDTKYNPILIGMDEGSSGKAVTQRMMESEDFKRKNYKKRLIPVNFSASIGLGFDADGKEITSKTKPFAVSTLQEYTNIHRIIYSTTDLELVTELERMTYTKTPNGDIVYRTVTAKGGKRGEDHFTSALLCAAMAFYIENEQLLLTKVPKLFSAKWVY